MDEEENRGEWDEAGTRFYGTFRNALFENDPGESDADKWYKANTLARAQMAMRQVGTAEEDKGLNEAQKLAKAMTIASSLIGDGVRDDVFLSGFNGGTGFKDGQSALDKMRLVVKGLEDGPEKDLDDFHKLPYEQGLKIALDDKSVVDGLVHSAGNAGSAVGDWWSRGGGALPLDKDELKEAGPEMVAASDVLRQNAVYESAYKDYLTAGRHGRKVEAPVRQHDEAKVKEATDKIRAWREDRYNRSVYDAYVGKLAKKARNACLSSIINNPVFGSVPNARKVLNDLLNSPDNAVPVEDEDLFAALPGHVRSLIVTARSVMKQDVESGFWNTLGDFAISMANTGLNVATSPYRQGTKLGNMIANAKFDAGIDINEINRRKQDLYAATGRFFSGGDLESGTLPMMQFEQLCDNHGMLANAVIGTASILGYGATVGTGPWGVAAMTLEAMQQMDDHVAAEGGDITNGAYNLSNLAFGLAYGYTEHLKWGGFLKSWSDVEIRKAFFEGYLKFLKDHPVQALKRYFTLGGTEAAEEGLQKLTMNVNEALFLDKDVGRAAAEGFVGDMIETLPSMMIVGPAGDIVGHARRSGFKLGDEGRAKRTADMTALAELFVYQDNLVAMGRNEARKGTEKLAAMYAGLYDEYKKHGIDAIGKAFKLTETQKTDLEEFYKAIEAEVDKSGASVAEAFGKVVGKGYDNLFGFKAFSDIADNLLEDFRREYEKGAPGREGRVENWMSDEFWQKYRAAWAKGNMLVSVETKDGQVETDLGAQELEKLGLGKKAAEKLSAFFHWERKHIFSRQASEAIRDLYDRQTRLQLTTPQVIEKSFKGGRVVYRDGRTFVRYEAEPDSSGVPGSGMREVEIRDVDLEEWEPNFDTPVLSQAQSIDDVTHGEVSAEKWMSGMTADERRETWKRLRWSGVGAQGGFSVIDTRSGNEITSRQLWEMMKAGEKPELQGVITVDPYAPNRATPFHELAHGYVVFAISSGLLTEADINALAADPAVGPATGRNELFNEENFSNAFRDYLVRRRAGSAVADTPANRAMEKLWSFGKRVSQEGEKRSADAKVAQTRMQAIFDQIALGVYSKVAEAAKGGSGVAAGGQDKPGGKTGTQKAETGTPQPETGTGEKKKTAAPVESEKKPQRKIEDLTWKSEVPNTGWVVGGHFAMYPLEDLVHSGLDAFGKYSNLQWRKRKDNQLSDNQIERIKNQFFGGRLFDTGGTESGAILVVMLPDEAGVVRPFVISGNGRTMSLVKMVEGHFFDKYSNYMREWCAERGVEIPADGKNYVVVRVLDDLGGHSLQDIAIKSNKENQTPQSETEIAFTDRQAILENALAQLYVPNRNGKLSLAHGANTDFILKFKYFADAAGIEDQDGNITEDGRNRILRAFLAIACGGGERGYEVVKSLIRRGDEDDGLDRLRTAMNICASSVAALESNPDYAVSADVSRGVADYMDFVDRRDRGQVGTFADYLAEQDMFSNRSEIAEGVLRLLGGSKNARQIADVIKAYCDAATKSDADGGLMGASGKRTREQVWHEAVKAAQERIDKERAEAEAAKSQKKAIRLSVAPKGVQKGAAVEYPDAADELRAMPDAALDARWSIGQLYTGSAADYENPSLLKVGTGEGAQVYGWGLYASDVRGVAERYADLDQKAKIGEKYKVDVLRNGKPFKEGEIKLGKLIHNAIAWGEGDYKKAFQYLEVVRDNFDSLKATGDLPKLGVKSLGELDDAARFIEEHGKEFSANVKTSHRHVYEQTFFTDRAPGDESHLLKWYEPVSEENLKRIVGQMDRENSWENAALPSDWGEIKSLQDKIDALKYFGSDIYAPPGQINLTGEKLYRAITYYMDSPKAASEFLARADIDGIKYPVDSYGGKTVKDGDKAGWNYVSFRDDNIKVDHKWVDGQQRWSVAELQSQRPYLNANQATDGALSDSGSPEAALTHSPVAAARRSLDRKTSQATDKAFSGSGNAGSYHFPVSSVVAARRSLDQLARIIANRPKAAQGVFDSLRTALKNIEDGKPVFVGGRELSAKNFVTSMQALGFSRKAGANSAYLVIGGDSAIRASDHSANAELFIQDGTDNNLSIVIRRPHDTKKFASDNSANVVEAVFTRRDLDEHPEKLPYIVRDIAEFIATGEYHDTAGAMAYNYSGSDAYQAAVRDRIHADALARGDMATAARMVREAAEKAGYVTDSSYQGTSAFNGAAPSANGYYANKEERKAAWEDGSFEDTQTFGDYIFDGIDICNFDFIIGDERYRRNATPERQEAIENLRGVLSQKGKTIRMYRSVPSDVKEGSFRNGDWITPSRSYAVENARIHGWGKKFRIIEQEVSVEDIWWDGNDIAEWGFDDGRESAYKNTKNNRKLLAPATYDDAGNLIPLSQRFDQNKADIRWSIGARRRAEFRELFGRKRPDIPWEDVAAYLDEIAEYETAKKQKLAVHWLITGAIELPEDAYKLDKAIATAERAKVDPFQYRNPEDIFAAFPQHLPKDPAIDPDTVPELTGKEERGHGITVYTVSEKIVKGKRRAGQIAMRKVINTHWGKDASPWCLLQGDGDGELTEESRGYWEHYSALPKKVAFLNGRLLAFMATDRNVTDDALGLYVDLRDMFPSESDEYEEWLETDEGQEEQASFLKWMSVNHHELLLRDNLVKRIPEQWWDRKDASHAGIPIEGKIEGDPLGRSGLQELKDGKLELVGRTWKGDRKNGKYEEWVGELKTLDAEFKNGRPVGWRRTYRNGELSTVEHYNEKSEHDRPQLEFGDNGKLYSLIEYGEGDRALRSVRFFRSGNLKSYQEIGGVGALAKKSVSFAGDLDDISWTDDNGKYYGLAIDGRSGKIMSVRTNGYYGMDFIANTTEEYAVLPAELRAKLEGESAAVLEAVKAEAAAIWREYSAVAGTRVMDDAARDRERWSIGGFQGAVRSEIGTPEQAERMEKAGADRTDIWRETGWWRGHDGKWRIELPDYSAGQEIVTYRGFEEKDEFNLGDIVKDKVWRSQFRGLWKLVQAYPDLRRLKVEFFDGTPDGLDAKAAYLPNENKIEVYSASASEPADIGLSLVHELQHAIQWSEGFSYGDTKATTVGEKTSKRNTKRYFANQGEVEAYLAQARSKMDDSQRAIEPPWETEKRLLDAISRSVGISIKPEDVRWSVSTAWRPDFPDATAQTTRKFINDHYAELFKRAKAGDVEAAEDLVEKVCKVDKIRQLGMDHPNARIVAPVIAQEASGHNQIPRIFAKYVASILGIETDTGIVQTVRANHTGAVAEHRLFVNPEFDGEVVLGAEYIVVDDHITQGGTVNALRDHIERNGGKVVAVASLTLSQGSSKLSPRKDTLDELYAKWPDIDNLLRIGNIAESAGALTESQAKYILKFSPDTFRDRAVAQGNEGSGRARGETLGASPSEEVSRSKRQEPRHSIAAADNPLAAIANAKTTQDIERAARMSFSARLADGDERAAERALVNYVAYQKLIRGGLPRPLTLARLGLALGMKTVSAREILKEADRVAEKAAGTVIEKAVRNGDVGTAFSLMEREKEREEELRKIISGGAKAGGDLVLGGVVAQNTLLGKRIEQTMRGMTAATLADMEGDTGLDLAAEILQNDPTAFDEELRKGTGNREQGTGAGEGEDEANNQQPTIGNQLTDYERWQREEAKKEAAKRVAAFIEAAKRRAEENRAKAERRREENQRRAAAGLDPLEPGSASDERSSGDAETVGGELYGKPEPSTAGFKNKWEFAAFLREWAWDKYQKTHGVTNLGKSEENRLFAEFYRICAVKQLQDLADKLLDPKGARAWANRRIGELEKGLKPDTIERASAEIFAFINRNAIREERTKLIEKFRKEIKQFITGAEFEELKADSTRRLTGWVEEAARYMMKVCQLSGWAANGGTSQFEKERQDLLDVINRRRKIYDESGAPVEDAEKSDAETIRARWKLNLLEQFGAMAQMMPGEIEDLRQDAIRYLTEEAAALEERWKDAKAWQDAKRRALAGAIVGPRGQKIPEKGYFGKLFDALNGMLRLRLKHLMRFAGKKERAEGEAAVNEIVTMLGQGEVAYARAVQRDRAELWKALGRIFQTPDGQLNRKAAVAYMKRMEEDIPEELAKQLSFQGYGEHMTYGQMLQLLVSLEQRSYAENVKANGREGQAELIRSSAAFTTADALFIDWLRAFYEAKREEISAVTERMVGNKVESPDPLYCPVKIYRGEMAKDLHIDAGRWNAIDDVLSRRVMHKRDFDESATVLGQFYDRSNRMAGLVAWAERGTLIENVICSGAVQQQIGLSFGSHESSAIRRQLEDTFNGGTSRSKTPGEIEMMDKAMNFVTFGYLGFNPLSAFKQTTSFTVWANVLPGGFRELWHHMTHIDRDAIRHIMESDEYKVRYGDDTGSGQDFATKALNENAGLNPFARLMTGPGMWLLKKGDFLPGVWIMQGVYKSLLNKHLNEGMEATAADRLAIAEAFNLLEETQQSGRTYNTNALAREHGRLGAALVQFATSPLQQLQYETQAFREWRDLKRYGADEERIAEARAKLIRAAFINHVLLPAAMELVIAVFRAIMGDEPRWEKDGYAWDLLRDVLLGQASRIFYVGVLASSVMDALFKRQLPRGSQLIPSEGAITIMANVAVTAHDVMAMDGEKVRKDLERMAKSLAPTRIPYNLYRRVIGDSDVDRKRAKGK